MSTPVTHSGTLKRKLSKVWKKNGPDLKAVLSGQIFRYFPLPPTTATVSREIPVFVFHEVTPELFEKQLVYLSKNGYSSLNADDLLARIRQKEKRKERLVALTFDDADCSFWTAAYPLLKKYGFKAILFISPALISNSSFVSPTLEECWTGRSTWDVVKKRITHHPFCTWAELLRIHESGSVDIQSHSLSHARINVSPQVVDFVHPGYDSFFKRQNIPLFMEDKKTDDLELPLGRPIYESKSRVSGSPRFFEDHAASERLMEYVRKRGAADFFFSPHWRKKLVSVHQRFLSEKQDKMTFESLPETSHAIKEEFIQTKQILSGRLGGKDCTHFCYPWFEGSKVADQLALECGYESVFCGLFEGLEVNHQRSPLKIRRLSEEYLFSLPGDMRKSVLSVWFKKIFRFVST